jgi:hypothetical protein
MVEGRVFPVPSNLVSTHNTTSNIDAPQPSVQQQQSSNERVIESAFECSDLVGRVIVSAALQRHLREEIDAGVRHTSASALLLLLSGGGGSGGGNQSLSGAVRSPSSATSGVEETAAATTNTTILASRSPSPKNPRDGQHQHPDHKTTTSSSAHNQQQQQDASSSVEDIQQYNVGFIPGSSSYDMVGSNSRDIVDMPPFPHSREDMQLLRLVRSFCCLRDVCRGYLLARKRLGITSLSDRRAEYEIKMWDKRNKMAAFLQRLVRKWIATCKVNERKQAVHRWNRYRIASEE